MTIGGPSNNHMPEKRKVCWTLRASLGYNKISAPIFCKRFTNVTIQRISNAQVPQRHRRTELVGHPERAELSVSCAIIRLPTPGELPRFTPLLCPESSCLSRCRVLCSSSDTCGQPHGDPLRVHEPKMCHWCNQTMELQSTSSRLSNMFLLILCQAPDVLHAKTVRLRFSKGHW